jgi:dolichyl-diphosphooligosaccharide--protein glycosyltransferase/undecaprenyl-diphosphooligosaccharide--protein glycosyltransferase
MNDFIQKYLKLEPRETSSVAVFLFIILAYAFGVAVRLILYYQVMPMESFWLDGKPLPIYSPDAGLYGYYAKQLLLGANYPLVAEYMPGYLIYWIVGIFSLNIDWAMFLLPAFLAPLVAVPIVLMGQALHQAKLGFFAALIGVVGINFYTRSYVGYMDTDTLNLFFPYMAIASYMMAISRRSWVWGITFFLFLAGFHFWYHSSLVIIAAIMLMALIMTPLIFRSKILGVVSVSIMILSLFVLDPQKITKRAVDYFEADTTTLLSTKKGVEYHFVNTLDTVSEAQGVDFLFVHESYVGMMPFILVATLGFVLLAIIQPLVLIALPMLFLGYLASSVGMRFMMFATPVFAMGFAGFAFIVIRNHKFLSPIFALFAVILMLVNILRVNPSFMPSFFTQKDVKALDDFANISQENDLLISWWDYGWPLWYYTGRNNTLVDNGRHGADTYLVANLLLSEDDAFVANALRYFADQQQGNRSILPLLAESEDLKKRFEDLKVHATPKQKERDIYFLVHRDMLLTFKTIEDFAHIDIETGNKTSENSQLFISDLLRPYSKKVPIVKGDTFDFDLRNGMISGHDGVSAQVQGVIIVDDDTVTAAKRYNPRAPMNLIIYNTTKAIYLDNTALNTFLIKALLFDQYNKNRFEKVTQTDSFKIFKLK